jgi:hypothetical protein
MNYFSSVKLRFTLTESAPNLRKGCHSGPDFHRDKLQPGDRREAERAQASEHIQYLRWFPTFVGTTSGCRIKSGMTEKGLYKQPLIKSLSNF